MGIVLLEGALHRVRRGASVGKQEVGPPAPPEVLRRPDLEKAPLSYQSDYWRQLGERTMAGLALVGERRLAAVVVSPGLALAPIGALDSPPPGDPRIPLPPSAPVGFQAIAMDPEAGVALFAISPTEAIQPLAAPDAGSASAGTLIAAVSLAPNGRLRVAPGHLVSVPNGSETLDVSIAFPPGAGAAALVDLDGRLVGVSVPSANGTRVLSAEAALRAVQRLHRSPRCEAIEVGALDDAVRRQLSIAGGALVVRVRDRSFATRPDIQPGDVVVRWNGRAVASPQEFERLYDAVRPGTAARALVRRGRLSLSVAVVVPPDCRPFREPALSLPALGLTVAHAGGAGERGVERRWVVVTVSPASPGAAAGLEAGDQLLSVDGRPIGGVTAAALRESLAAAGSPHLITLQRGDKILLQALPSATRGRDGR